jgi:hypothetical protein
VARGPHPGGAVRVWRAWWLILLGVLPLAGGGPAIAEEAAGVAAVWKDPDGRPLRLHNEEQILEFLQTAPIVKSTRIPVGITKPLRLLLEEDDVRVRAAFRYEEEERRNVSVEGRHYRRFRDSCRFECAAYRLSRLLGLDRVPPTTERRFQGRSGSIQIWVEGGRDEEAKDFNPPDPLAWVRQTWDQDLFDALIFNIDRNSSNVIVDQDYRLWLIDHTRAFQPVPELLDPERITRVNRLMWTRLRNLDEDTLKEELGTYLDGEEMMCLMRRRELLLEKVDRLLAERGNGILY